MRLLSFLILSLLFSLNLYSTDIVVDSNLSNGNGSSYFNSLIEALNASKDGDRILIKQGNYSYETITIEKAIKVLPYDLSNQVQIKANLVINPPSGKKVEILGIDFSNYQITASCIDCSEFSEINLIRIKANNIVSNNRQLIHVNLFNSIITSDVISSGGNYIKNTIGGQLVIHELRDYVDETGEKYLIIGNSITGVSFNAGWQKYGRGSIGIFQDERGMLIANNECEGGIKFLRWDARENVVNKIHNNNFKSIFRISDKNVPRYNFEITSNIWEDFIYPTRCNDCFSGFRDWDYNYNFSLNFVKFDPLYDNYNEREWTSDKSTFPNPNVPGFFKFTYNGNNFKEPHQYYPNSSILNFDIIEGVTDIINKGNPSHEFYDLDLSINDRGSNGGPYGMGNIEIEGQSDLKSYIYYMNTPTDIFSGDNIQIEIKGYINGN